MAIFKKGDIMEKVIKNMNFKPILENIVYKRLAEPAPSSTINMRVWDEMKVERLRQDAVKVYFKRNVKPQPDSLFSLEAEMSVEVIVNGQEFDDLADAVAYFKNSQVARVLASTVGTVVAELTLHSQIGPMMTAPVAQFPQ